MGHERSIIEECLARFRELDTVRTVELRPGPADGLLALTTDSGRFQYLCEVKRALNRPRLEHALVSAEHPPKAGTRRLLLTDFLPGPLIDRLQATQVDFVDAAGNMLVRWPGKLHVHVKGMKPTHLAEAKASFLTTPNGLRVLFALLADSGTEVPAYRQLSEQAAVSLGTVGRVALELKRRGFLETQRRKRLVLRRKRELLDLWVGGYGERLRPQLVIGRFRPSERELGDALRRLGADRDSADVRWALTGGFAAEVLSGHYRGDQLILFIDPWSSRLAAALRWLPSPEGPITVLRMFWPETVERTLEKGGTRVAHPLLVYAELLFQGRDREVETAKLIYEQYLRPKVSDA